MTFTVIRCGYTAHSLTWEITLLPREIAFSSVTDLSQGKFPVLNIHGDVKKITRSAHDIYRGNLEGCFDARGKRANQGLTATRKRKVIRAK